MAAIDSYPILGYAKAVRTDVTGDNAIIDIPINEKGYVVKGVTVYNANGNNATAAVGVFGAAAGAGAVIVANVALTAVTGPTVVQEMTVAATAVTPAVTADKLYVRVGTASGVAGSTVDVVIYGYSLP